LRIGKFSIPGSQFSGNDQGDYLMQTTSNAAAADKTAEKTGTEKPNEKLAEKRRALGRGLESLLPGPRVVTVPPRVVQTTPTDGAPDLASASSSGAIASSGASGVPARPPSEGEAAPGTLDELQAVASGRTADGEPVYEIPLAQIRNNPHQTRVNFDKRYLEELAQSIAVQGVLQPVVVRPGAARGEFVLILGERRMRASLLAGKPTIPAIVKRVSEQQAAEMTLTENLQRQDLDCLEQAAAFSFMSLRFSLTQEQIGKRVGVSREQVSNYLRLLKLPKDVIEHMREKTLGYSHARLLLRLEDDEQISKMAAIAVEKRMSVAQLEDEVLRLTVPGRLTEPEKPASSGARWVDPNVRAAQRTLETVLGMRVRIRDRKGKGKITIEYGTLGDFDRVVNMLKGK